MRKLGRAVLFGAVGVLVVMCLSGCADYYVSPNGNDSWSGELEEPNKGQTDGPFRTLERARDAVRALKKQPGGLKDPVTINIRKGTYYLDAPFVLTSDDSGSKGAPISYQAYNDENVVISGGRPITGFKEVEVNGRKMIAAYLPEVKDGKWYFTQLFVNNRRRPRARLPRGGYFRTAGLLEDEPNTMKGQDAFKYSEGDLKPWRNLDDVDIVALTFWVESRMGIKALDESAHTVHLTSPSIFRLLDDHDTTKGARYWVENVPEALDRPGQWYLDRREGMLYYYPYAGEDWKRATFVAPRLDHLVRVEGSAGKPVEAVWLTGLKFAHTEYRLPRDLSGFCQADWGVPGAIRFVNARDCVVGGCEISHIGTYGIEIGPGCERTFLAGNKIVDMGAGGFNVRGGSNRTTISDNDIWDGCKIFNSAPAVFIMDSGNNRVAHNHIHDMDQIGVSVGWVWGYGASKAAGNVIEFNHIHDVGRGVLSDLGGIYVLGARPGTIVRGNLVHDCYSYSYGGWGIYLDEGSTGVLVENNIVYNTKTGGFHQHYGKENRIVNNIFAFAKEGQLQRTRPEPHKSFTFKRNIVYFTEGTLLAGAWGDDGFTMDYNLYLDARGTPIDFLGATLDQWQNRGNDAHSLIADPLFVDAAKHDFRLKPKSPAFKLGFKQIDLSHVGPRPLEQVEPPLF